MSKTALIVGGAGATGQHIVRGLAARGYDVTVLHRGVHEPAYLLPYRHLHADPHFAEPVLQVLGRENFDVVVLTYGRIEQLAKVFAVLSKPLRSSRRVYHCWSRRSRRLAI